MGYKLIKLLVVGLDVFDGGCEDVDGVDGNVGVKRV